MALDFPNHVQALDMADRLKQEEIDFFKIGMELFTAMGPAIVRAMQTRDIGVFLDLKFHDIPNTVSRAVRAATDLGVTMMTVHMQGGKKMCLAARAALESMPERPLLFGVTALTSLGYGEMPGITMPPHEFARELASQALSWGLDGVICSGLEVMGIKRDNPELLCICPGIRLKNDDKNDQARIITPEGAARHGADFIVVGRPITQADDPAAAARDIISRIRSC